MTTPLREARMPIVVVGHVDHGKSTIIGRLLADTGSLPEGKLEQVRGYCERHSRPFEHAFLLDALKDEQSQGITIDAARVFFASARRQYLIIDAPGHVEFLKNMVTGASRAEAALLVIDASEGVQENSRRHGTLLSLLGIRQVVVLVNKMDLVGFAQPAFAGVVREYGEFLDRLGLRPLGFVPVAGRLGEGICGRTGLMPWYQGPTVLDVLDAFASEAPAADLPLRLPVQDVYKFTNHGDDRRIVAGTVLTGAAAVGDEVVFYPSGKRGRIRTLEAFNQPPRQRAEAGQATGITLEQQIYVSRGEIAAPANGARPFVSSRFRASLFWLGKAPLLTKKEYLLKLGTARVGARVEEIHRVLDASDLRPAEPSGEVGRNMVAECTLKLSRAIAFDVAAGLAPTGRFVLVDDHRIRGGGIVRESLPDRETWVRENVLRRNFKWEQSTIPPERRCARYAQKAALVLITGSKDSDRKALGKALEARLFGDGRFVYFLGIGNVLYGVDADIDRSQENRREHMRRLAEVSHLMLDAGVLLIVTAAELTLEDLDIIRTTLAPDSIETIWVGKSVTTDLVADLHLPEAAPVEAAVDRIQQRLQDRRIILPAKAGPRPAVIWFTGLSGSGKTTIAQAVCKKLALRGVQVEHLDGDSIRDLFPKTGFTRDGRDQHVKRVGYLAGKLERHGVFVVVSLVSPYEDSRRFARGLCQSFLEVYVATPLEECERRDVKGLYARARRGEIESFTGISDPYEPPSCPDLEIDTRTVSVEDAVARVLSRLPDHL